MLPGTCMPHLARSRRKAGRRRCPHDLYWPRKTRPRLAEPNKRHSSETVGFGSLVGDRSKVHADSQRAGQADGGALAGRLWGERRAAED